MKIFLLILALFASPMLSAQQVIEVIELKSQIPQNIVPVIRPLLGQGATVTSMNNRLILKAEPNQIDDIRKLINQLDRPPQRLLIEISHDGSHRGQQSDFDVKGRIITTGNNRVNVQIKERSTRNQFDANQMVQATEGYPALINYGQVIPYREHHIEAYGHRVRKQSFTSFEDATSGFYVVPRLSGNRVSLEILQHRNRYQPQNRSISVQNTSTFLSGQLGEWISLGSVGESSYQRDQGIISRRTRDLNQDQEIYVRVTLAD